MDAQRYRYLAEGNAHQARKRVAADVLIRDEAGRLLLVDPGYKPNWDLPGGMVEANEPPIQAAQRELHEELALQTPIGRLLYLEWVPPHDPWDDQLAMIFDGGILDDRAIAGLRLADHELRAFEFVALAEAADRLRPYVYERVRLARAAADTGTTHYTESSRTDIGERQTRDS
jgi:ADP-ribose pyrophosphatase YjhB (NUDIX family)